MIFLLLFLKQQEMIAAIHHGKMSFMVPDRGGEFFPFDE
jgi:hypothetical protein